KIKAEDLKNKILITNSKLGHLPDGPKLSIEARKGIEKAVLIANLNNHKYVGTEHLLISLEQLQEKDWLGWLAQNQINLKRLKDYAPLLLKTTSRFSEITDNAIAGKEAIAGHPLLPGLEKTASALENFTTNLTDDEIQQNIDPVIGREEEISRLIQILARRTKNNPVLLGEAGVGKTAIVEGLAKKILAGQVPDVLLNKKIICLDLGATVAGTMFRGEFENRIKQIIEQVKNDPNLILFIDELHNIIGAGSAQGSLDAANILKPALARGQLRCIGATTFNEYKKHIANDPALERRFQPIIIEEPTADKTKAILLGIKENYEKYHQVSITNDAIEAAVDLSQRYLTDSFLPDKAIDLLDEAASGKRIKKKKDKDIQLLEDAEMALKKISQDKEKAIQAENFSQAMTIKGREQSALAKLEYLKAKIAGQKVKTVGKITRKEIAEIIAKMTKVPVTDLLTPEKDQLLNLEKIIGQKIIGQDEAVQAISQAIRRARAGLASRQRPLGSFIFLGPSGVGKTELAKVLAETVFGSPKALIRLDMSEFSESFNISKLIGAPAGYVGYRDTNKLTDAVRHRPYSVVLFDEIEKAHPETFNLLLQILEDGQLTDATGKAVNFKNTIIILTSNIGLSELNHCARLGFGSQANAKPEPAEAEYGKIKERLLAELKEQFRPEFLNRLDKIIIFRPLNQEAIKKIVGLQITELNQRLAEMDIRLILDQASLDLIALRSHLPQEGARAIRRNIQELLENQLADQLLKNQIKAGCQLSTQIKNNEIVLN
ncbi:MAG: ATP-dependent Clp protease ATP-binding subunit, partial [bacterium]